MSAYYLIDAHTNPILSSEINDVVDSRTDVLSSGNPAAIVNGNFVVRIPDNQRLASDPTDLGDLLTQKYNGLKESSGFSYEAHDALLDASQIVPFSSGYKLGERGSVAIYNGGNLRTAPQALATTASLVVVFVDFFRWKYINPKDGRLLRVYEEVPPSEAPGISVSTNGGTNFTSVPAGGGATSIPPAEAGASLVLNFGSPSYNDTIHIGSWAVIY